MKIYYSTQRPIAPGTYPKQGAGNIVNFDEKTYVQRLGHEAWGYIYYDEPLPEDVARSYELTPEPELDFSLRYSVGEGTSTYATFATAAELNAWFDAQDTEGRYFCRLYDREKRISILGCDYMWLKPEKRWHDDPQESLFDWNMNNEVQKM